MRKYLIPDSNDQIRQQQMREIQVRKKVVKFMQDITGAPDVLVYVLIHMHKLSCLLICSGTYEDVGKCMPMCENLFKDI